MESLSSQARDVLVDSRGPRSGTFLKKYRSWGALFCGVFCSWGYLKLGSGLNIRRKGQR